MDGDWVTDDSATYTENGALSYPTSGTALTDLFFKTVRGVTELNIFEYLNDSWYEDPLMTLRAIFHLRDCRGGKGERAAFQKAMFWLRESHKDVFEKNLEHVPFYGTYKDLLVICSNNESHKLMVKIFAETLAADLSNPFQISLAAKWAPTEGSYYDRQFKIAKKISRELTNMQINSDGMRGYRKILSTLRSRCNIVEIPMCSKQWDQIDYQTVPSVAMLKYRKAFLKHGDANFRQYIKDVSEGRQKINSNVFPHQLVGKYLGPIQSGCEEVVELQWKTLVDKTREKFATCGLRGIAMVDVSGSMDGEPLNVAISLGLLVSELLTNKFNGSLITFSSHPHFHYIDPADSLRQKVNSIKRMNWHQSTNLVKAIRLILDHGIENKIPTDEMPTTLYIFSDMQFDAAFGTTNIDHLEKSYEEAGYVRPNVVFWNLRSNTVDFPACNIPRCALVSGFSQSLLELFTDGEEMSPRVIIEKALNNERYLRLKL